MAKTKKYRNLRDTAAHCGVTEKTLRNYISRYPELPVARRGIGREGYKFDISVVDQWRKRTGLLGVAPATLGTDTSKLERDAKARRMEVQTKLLELELDKRRGLLVEKEEVVQFLSMKMARFAKQHELLPNLIGKKLNFSDEAIRMFRDHLDQARHAMVNDDQGYFAYMDLFDN